MCKSLRFCFASMLVLAVCALSAMAQSTTTGAINGAVTNPNKEVVTGATVTAKNNGTNKEATATTDDNGGFKVVNLEPGIYTVTVNSSGFAPFTNENVVVEIGRSTPLDIGLSLQGVTGTVQVTAEAPVLNNTSQDFASNINQTSINELPINGRRWSNFAILTPGAVPDGTFGLISFRGISGLLNNSTVDGGDNNQAFFSEERGRTRISYSISQSAIREFQVNTSSYSAEYGRSAGGVTNAVTKSGTNEFHGSAFFYDRNNKWGTRNPRAFKTLLVDGIFQPVAFKPEDVRYQFGGTVGGPIVKDKAFFFFSYDQQKRNFPGLSVFSAANFLNTADRCLLTAPLNQNVTTAGTCSGTRSAGTLIGKGLTSAQVDTALNFLNSISGPVPRRADQRLLLPKIDWRITPNNTLTGTYNRLRWKSPAGIQSQATNTRAVDNFGDDFVNIDWVTIRLASTLSSKLVNEGRFQWARDFEFEFSQPPLPGEPTTAINGRSPQTFITNGFSFGIPEFLERPQWPDERRLQWADTVTYTTGNHAFKFGADLNRVRDISNSLRYVGGEFNYTGGANALGFNTGLNDFIIDYTNFRSPLTAATTSPCYGSTSSTQRSLGKCYGSNFNQGFGLPGISFVTIDYNLFFQDDWRVMPRLTLNLGLRYEYQKNPFARFINPAIPQTAVRVDDRDNFGPRVGFAFDVNGDGKTSIRGGWGIYYGRLTNASIFGALVNTGLGPDQAQRQISVPSGASSPVYPNLLTSGASTPAVLYFVPGFQMPLIHQLDAVLEREIARNTVVSASYLFSYGKNLPNFVDINLNPPTTFQNFTISGGPFDGQIWRQALFTGARPNAAYSQIAEIRSNVWSKYNALVLQFNRRMTNGLQIQSNYTLSRAYDSGQTSSIFTSAGGTFGTNNPYNAFDQAGENGLSAFDRRHKFVFSLVYNTHYNNKDNQVARALLNGWTIAPIFNAFSGARFTAVVSGSPSGTTAGGINGSFPSFNRFALVPRNFFKQPSIQYLDLRLSRRFDIGEKAKVEVLGEVFNVLNRTQVTGVNTTIYSLSGTTLTYNTPFATTTAADSTLFRERQVQLAVRFEF